MYQQNEKLKIGKIYKGIREMAGFSKEDVSMGLLSSKELSRFENDESYPGSYMLQILFERAGKSLRHFLIMMSKPEYQYQLWRRDIVARIVQGKTVKQVVYEGTIGKYIDEKLHLQFCTFWQGYLENDLKKMQLAISYTVLNYPDGLTMKNCLSMEEINYMLLFMEKKLVLYPGKWMEEYASIQFLLRYIEMRFEGEEMVEIYGRAVYVFGKYMDISDINEKILQYKKAIELKRRNFKIEGMDRLLEGILAEYQKINQQPPENFTSMLVMLQAIKKEYQIEDTFWQTKPTYEVYLLSEVLQKYRSEKNKTVKDVAKNCCSEKTYRTLENGIRDAKGGTLDLLCEELEIPLGSYNADIITENYADIALVDKIKMVSKRAVKGDELQLLNQLKKLLGDKAEYIQNRQLLKGMTDIALFMDREITAEQYHERLKNAISLTIPDGWQSRENHFFTRMEMMLVYYAAVLNRRMGKPEKAMAIADGLWKQLEQSMVLLEDRKQETALLMVLRKNLLTDVFHYEEALKTAAEGIKYSFKSGDASKLYEFLFEIGWIYDEMAKEKNEYMKWQYRKYFEYALCISEMFYIERNAKVIKRYLA